MMGDDIQVFQRIFGRWKIFFLRELSYSFSTYSNRCTFYTYGVLNLPANLWKIRFFCSRVELSYTFRKMVSRFQATHQTTDLPPPTNNKQPKATPHPAQHHTAHSNPMAIMTTASRNINPPRRAAANDDQHATTTHPTTSKRKADTDDGNVETLHQKSASVDDDKITKSPSRTKRKKSHKAIDGDNNKAPPETSNDKAKMAHETEALHAASKDKGGDQQPANGEGKDYFQQTSKSNEGGALESSSDLNHSSTQGLTTPVKGTTVSKHGYFPRWKNPYFFSSL